MSSVLCNYSEIMVELYIAILLQDMIQSFILNNYVGKEITITPKKTEFSSIDLLAAGAVGALVGAGLGLVTSIALRDEKTRQKLKEVLDTVNQKAGEYLKQERVKKAISKTPISRKRIAKIKEPMKRLEAP